MLKICLLYLLTLILTLNCIAQVHVSGYYRKNGTYVQPHYRSNPDGNPYNNWSYPGNVNPYTGKVASGNPDTYLDRYYNRSSSRTYTPIYYDAYLDHHFDNLSTTFCPPIDYPIYYHSSPGVSSSTYPANSLGSTKSASNRNKTSTPVATSVNNSSATSNTYSVISSKAYFYTQPYDHYRKGAYLVSGDSFQSSTTQNNFVFVDFTNQRGQRTTGWIKLSDLSQ